MHGVGKVKTKIGRSELWHVLTTYRYTEKAHETWDEFGLESSGSLIFL